MDAALLGAVAGLIVGFAIVVAITWWNDFRSADEVAERKWRAEHSRRAAEYMGYGLHPSDARDRATKDMHNEAVKAMKDVAEAVERRA